MAKLKGYRATTKEHKNRPMEDPCWGEYIGRNPKAVKWRCYTTLKEQGYDVTIADIVVRRDSRLDPDYDGSEPIIGLR